MTRYWPLIVAGMLTIFCSGCEGVAHFPISDATADNADDRIIGKWKVMEDSDKNNYYEIYAAHPNFKYQYHYRVWDHGGTNPTFEGNCYFSKVGVTQFLNVPHYDEEHQKNCFLFIRILDADEGFDKLTVTSVCDTNMRALTSKEAVKAHIAKNLKNRSFYDDTVHFYRVK